MKYIKLFKESSESDFDIGSFDWEADYRISEAILIKELNRIAKKIGYYHHSFTGVSNSQLEWLKKDGKTILAINKKLLSEVYNNYKISETAWDNLQDTIQEIRDNTNTNFVFNCNKLYGYDDPKNSVEFRFYWVIGETSKVFPNNMSISFENIDTINLIIENLQRHQINKKDILYNIHSKSTGNGTSKNAIEIRFQIIE